ncbi:MAG: DNA-binding response regulator [Anaerolineales bacterium]|nr:DNA-binding response regulator [Anaerolineales bacterium]
MKNQPHILVIDDEPQILRALKTILRERDFRVTTAGSGEEGLALAAAEPPDLIVLDLTLPKMDGIEVCARLREWTQLPILVLSVRGGERDKVAALDAGADDYLTKPFGIEELLARIRVGLRHAVLAKGSPSVVISSGPVVIDLSTRQVTRDGAAVRLTPTEYRLLAYLSGHAGRVLTHQTILANVWGDEYRGHTEYLRVYIRQLRKKLEPDPDDPQILLTEPGIGYRFVTPE